MIAAVKWPRALKTVPAWQAELQLVLTNFQSLDDRDLLLFPEIVMEKLLVSDGLAISSEKLVLERLLYWMKHEAGLRTSPPCSCRVQRARMGANLLGVVSARGRRVRQGRLGVGGCRHWACGTRGQPPEHGSKCK